MQCDVNKITLYEIYMKLFMKMRLKQHTLQRIQD